MSSSTDFSKLPLCPQSPNCVSSESSNSDQRISPLRFTGISPDQAMVILKHVLLTLTNQVQERDNGSGLHAEVKSSVFGFVDEIDALLNPDRNQIDIRSASRTGYYDFGVNRRRIEQIRNDFDKRVMQAQKT
ncbi:MAG TPA: DUF1499 domain-containing protein [Crenotrichaceae bacterium]|nr:DUF1499 domain-containing protein [Crenotrichaceae bacterium]